MRPSVMLRSSRQPTKIDHHPRRRAIHERATAGHHIVIKDGNNTRNRMQEIARSTRRDGVTKVAIPDTHAPAGARRDGQPSCR